MFSSRISARLITVSGAEMLCSGATENLHFTVELEHDPPHLMLWAGVTPTHLTDPCFLDGPADGASYQKYYRCG
jgi:hypothetical protein